MLVDRTMMDGDWNDTVFENVIGNSFWFGNIFINPIPDKYTMVISALVGTVGTVTITTEQQHNPYNGRAVTGVDFASLEAHYDIIPGLAVGWISANVANGHTATIEVGTRFGSFDSSGASAGIPSAGVRHQVENDDFDYINCRAVLSTQAIAVNKTGKLIVVDEFALGATEKVTGTQTQPYVLSLSAGNLLLDGAAFPANSIQNQTDGMLGNGTAIDVGDFSYHKVVSGPLTGLLFYIRTGAVNGNESNVFIFPNRYVQIAEDIGGIAGAYGVADVILTGPGRDPGVMLAGDFAYYWSGIVVPSGSGADSNPYPANVALQGSYEGVAPW